MLIILAGVFAYNLRGAVRFCMFFNRRRRRFGVSILFGAWPMILALLTSWLFRGDSRYQSISGRAFALFSVAFAGMVTGFGG